MSVLGLVASYRERGAKHSSVSRRLIVPCLIVGLAVLGQGGDSGNLEENVSGLDSRYGCSDSAGLDAWHLSHRVVSDRCSVRDGGSPSGSGSDKGKVDARLVPLADLQAQGGTPTATTLANAPRERGDGSDSPEDKAQDGTANLICAYPWPQGCDYWIEVAACESTLGLDPWAYDERNPYTGLFQIWEGHGYGYEWLINDANNILAAWELSYGGTYTGAWPYCQWQ